MKVFHSATLFFALCLSCVTASSSWASSFDANEFSGQRTSRQLTGPSPSPNVSAPSPSPVTVTIAATTKYGGIPASVFANATEAANVIAASRVAIQSHLRATFPTATITAIYWCPNSNDTRCDGFVARRLQATQVSIVVEYTIVSTPAAASTVTAGITETTFTSSASSVLSSLLTNITGTTVSVTISTTHQVTGMPAVTEIPVAVVSEGVPAGLVILYILIAVAAFGGGAFGFKLYSEKNADKVAAVSADDAFGEVEMGRVVFGGAPAVVEADRVAIGGKPEAKPTQE